jgi:hypothetical protein
MTPLIAIAIAIKDCTVHSRTDWLHVSDMTVAKASLYQAENPESLSDEGSYRRERHQRLPSNFRMRKSPLVQDKTRRSRISLRQAADNNINPQLSQFTDMFLGLPTVNRLAESVREQDNEQTMTRKSSRKDVSRLPLIGTE